MWLNLQKGTIILGRFAFYVVFGGSLTHSNYNSQCAPGFFNLNQKVHGLFDFYNAVIYIKVKNQLKKPSVIGLPKFTIVNWLKNAIKMQILV